MNEREFSFDRDLSAEMGVETDMETADLAGEPIPEDMIPQPTGYRIVVRPKPAASKRGSLYLASRTKNTDLAVRTIGQVLRKGPLAWTATLDGMSLKDDNVAASIAEGDWVVFRQHGAQKIKIGVKAATLPGEEPEEQYLLLMSDTDVLAKLTPAQAAAYYDWVS